jgi:hypothetical protein
LLRENFLQKSSLCIDKPKVMDGDAGIAEQSPMANMLILLAFK